MAPGTLCVWGRASGLFFLLATTGYWKRIWYQRFKVWCQYLAMFLVWLKAAQNEDLFEKHVFCLPEVYRFICSFFASVCLFVSSLFVFASLCFFVCFLFMCLSRITLGKKDAPAWLFLYICITYIYIYYIIDIHTSTYMDLLTHADCSLFMYQHVTEHLRSPALTGPCQALLQKLLFLGCGIGDGWLGKHCSNSLLGIKHKAGRAIFNRIIWESHCEIWDVSGFGNRWQRTMCSHTVFSHPIPGIYVFLHEQLCATYIYLPTCLYKIPPARNIAHVDSVCFATSLLVCIAWVLACWHNVPISSVQAGRVHPGDGHGPDTLLKGTSGTIDSIHHKLHPRLYARLTDAFSRDYLNHVPGWRCAFLIMG